MVFAGLGSRALAFLMDCLLMGVLCLFLLDKILIPIYHPGVDAEVRDAYESYQAAITEAMESGEELPDAASFIETESIIEAVQFGLYVFMGVFFTYFLISELAMSGATLGKRILGMQTVIYGSTFVPGLIQSILRAALKTFFLFGALPFTWLGFFMAFFTQGKRSAHDIICRTAVLRVVIKQTGAGTHLQRSA